MLESYCKLQQKPKQFPSIKCTSHDLVCLTGESLDNSVKGSTTSDCRHVCQPTVDILNI